MARVSLVGAGRWGRHILRDLLTLGCDVQVADPDPDARRAARDAGAGPVAARLTDLPACNGIVVATPAATHASVLGKALGAGVPVFVEKPMTTDAPSAVRLAAHAGDRLFVMDKWRYHPGIEELRLVRERGEIGRIVGLRVTQAGWGTPHADVDAIWSLLPHALSVALEVLGHLPPAAYAFVERLDGQPVALSGRLGEAPWMLVDLSIRSPRKRREFHLHGERGVAWLDDASGGHVSIALDSGAAISRVAGAEGGDAPDVERRPVSQEWPLLRELRAFVEHLDGGPPPRSSALDGALVVERIGQVRRLAGLE